MTSQEIPLGLPVYVPENFNGVDTSHYRWQPNTPLLAALAEQPANNPIISEITASAFFHSASIALIDSSGDPYTASSGFTPALENNLSGIQLGISSGARSSLVGGVIDTTEPYVYSNVGWYRFVLNRDNSLFTLFLDDGINIALGAIAARTYTVGVPVNDALPQATLGTAPIAYVAFNLPPGLAIRVVANVPYITGTPTDPAVVVASLQATDANGARASRSFDILVSRAPVSVSSASVLTLAHEFTPGESPAAWGTLVNGGMVAAEAVHDRIDLLPHILFRATADPSTAPPPPDVTPATHSFEMITGSFGGYGYNAQFNIGSIAAGFSAAYNTPAGTAATVIHCRTVGAELNFALSGVAQNAAEFPSRIVLTRLTGSEVIRTLVPQVGSTRPVSGGIRQDYDPQEGQVTDVLSGNNIRVRVDLFYP